VADPGPDLRPRLNRPAAEPDRLALLVVVDAVAVFAPDGILVAVIAEQDAAARPLVVLAT
jgi:hypothetical protein